MTDRDPRLSGVETNGELSESLGKVVRFAGLAILVVALAYIGGVATGLAISSNN